MGIHKTLEEVCIASLLNIVGKKEMDMYETLQWDNPSHALEIDLIEHFVVVNMCSKRATFSIRQKCKNHGKVGHFAVKCRSGKSEKVNSNAVDKVFLHL